ncbi:MAG: trigger factor [Verrucomicrobia bacterium]|nr:trigger factor [Verrucomicrobiota bacterium]
MPTIGIDHVGGPRTLADSLSRNRIGIPIVNIQLNSISDTRKSLVVTLDQSEVDAEHLAVVKEVSQQARIPGFRPGKAPAAMVTKRFGKEIAEEFKQKVVSKAYRSALEKQKLDVLNIVSVEPGEVGPGKSADVTITVDVRPDFKLPEYTGLPTEVASTDSTDADVDSVIEGMRAERAEFKVAERPAAKSDYVKLSYEGSIDGKPIADLAADKQIYAKVPQTWEEVDGANEGVIPGLGKHLAGLKPGDKKSIEITFPADFAAVPALSGKSATYAVEILEVRERALPPIDEAFLKANKADTLDALKASVRNNLKLQKEYQNRSEQRRQVTEALAAKVDFAVPDSLVENETQNVLRQFIEENMRRGVPEEQFEKDKDALFANARQSATKRIKMQLLLAKIAEEEKLQVSEKDIDAFIYREAMRTQQKPDKLVKALTADREQLRAVQQSIIFDKAVDFLVSKAKVSTIPPKAS